MTDAEIHEIWQERLRLLKKIHIITMQVLADAQSLNPPNLGNRWQRLDNVWRDFLANLAISENLPAPSDVAFRDEILKESRINAALLQSLQVHCKEVKSSLGGLIENVREWARGAQFLQKMPAKHIIETKV